MKMAPSTAQNFAFRIASIAFGEPGAKQSQGEKPCNAARLSRTASVDYSLWSHLSLHSRQGIKASLARPLLARPPSPRPSPLGLSGSGVCFDGTHLAARPLEIQGTFAPDVDQPAKARGRYHISERRASCDSGSRAERRDRADGLGPQDGRAASRTRRIALTHCKHSKGHTGRGG